jgi:hypothetical protein
VGELQQAQVLMETSGGAPYSATIPIQVGTSPPPPPAFSVYLPTVSGKQGGPADRVQPTAPAPELLAYSWLEPALPSDRTLYAMTGVTDVVLAALPKSVTVGTQTFNSMRIFADGFLALPATAPFTATYPTAPGLNDCLPSSPTTRYPQQAVFGWWSDLDPAAPGATVSSFVLGERMVVEYDNVPAVAPSTPYTVSFQIVLDDTGGVQINYKDVPDFVGRPDRVTVGVQINAARFFSQAACSTSERVYGFLPTDATTIKFAAKDMF